MAVTPDKPKEPIGQKVPLDVLGENHTLFVNDAGVLTIASKESDAKAKLAEIKAAVTTGPSVIKDNAANDAAAAEAGVSEISVILTKAVGGDLTAKQQVVAKQIAIAGPIKRTWAWSKLAADPQVEAASLDDPFKHPYWVTFKQRMTILKAAGQVDVDPVPFAATIWEKLCKAVKAAAPNMTDPEIFQKEKKNRIEMTSAPFKKAVSEFDIVCKEIAKAATSQFATKQTFGFWSTPEGKTMSEGMNELTLETSVIGGLLDGLPTLDGKKMGWDPELWGALSKAYAEAMIPYLVEKKSTKKVNVCIGGGVEPGNVWDAVESAALSLGLEAGGKTLSKVAKYWGAAALSKADRSKLDTTKNVGYAGAVYGGPSRPDAIKAATAHFDALPQAPKPADPQLKLFPDDPAAAKPPAANAPAPAANAANAPAPAGAQPQQLALPLGGPTPAAQPKAPDPAAVSKYADGSPPPGWQDQVGTKVDSALVSPDDPGHTYHLLEDGDGVATSKSSKLAKTKTEEAQAKSGFKPKGQEKAPPGKQTIADRRKDIAKDGGSIPPYVTKSNETEYWYNLKTGKYPRRDGKRTATNYDVQTERYWEILRALKLPVGDFKTWAAEEPTHDEYSEQEKATKAVADAFRHQMVQSCIVKYGGSLESMDQHVFQKGELFSQGNHTGIQGEIFDQWCALFYGFKRIKFKWVIEGVKGEDDRKFESDGVLEGTDTFVESKSHTFKPTENVTVSGVGVDTDQMADYKGILSEIDKPKMSRLKAVMNKKGYYVDSNGVRVETLFKKVKYYLNNPQVAFAYQLALDERQMQGHYILEPKPEKAEKKMPAKVPAAPLPKKLEDKLKDPDFAEQQMQFSDKPPAAPDPKKQPAYDPSLNKPGEPAVSFPSPAAPVEDEKKKKKEVGTKVPMTVKKKGHTQFIDPTTKKPMVASTPTPVSDKLRELGVKLESLDAADPQKAVALAEIVNARNLEKTLADLAAQAALPTPTATQAQVEAAQQALAPSVAKIWEIAEPGDMDAAEAKKAIDATVPDCNDISDPYSAEWAGPGKTRAKFEAEFVDKNKLRHLVIEKYLSPAADPVKIKKVGSKDPIALQKFQDIDNEQHLTVPSLIGEFYTDLYPHMIKPEYADRTRTYPLMKTAIGYSKYVCKGTPVPASMVTNISSRNHSIDRMYEKASGAVKTDIENSIETELRGKGVTNPAKISIEKAKPEARKRAYRHILANHATPHKTVEQTAALNPFNPNGEMWFSPGEISVAPGPENTQFKQMMTLGALQPEWYGQGTCVLKIDAALRPRTREIYKPTAFDGLMSALWTPRNNAGEVYGLTGGGAAEFLEKGITYADVSSSKAVVPTDDFIEEMARVAAEVSAKAPAGASSTEEMLRGNNTGTPTGEVKQTMTSVVDRTKQEQNAPGAMPANAQPQAPLPPAAAPTPAMAPGGAMDPVNGPAKENAPKPPGPQVGVLPGVAKPPAPGEAPGPKPSEGGLQANDKRNEGQSAAGAKVLPALGGDGTQTVAAAAEEKHGVQLRDTNFNPVSKVALERDLAALLLKNAKLYDATVTAVSQKILGYFEERLTRGVTTGLQAAQAKYTLDLASLTEGSAPGWWGAVETAANATKADIAAQTKKTLTTGSLPQKLAVHQNFINVLSADWETGVMQSILGAATEQDPWFVRMNTKMKNGKLDSSGERVFKDTRLDAAGNPHDDKAEQARIEAERGRVKRDEMGAIGPAGAGIGARNKDGEHPGALAGVEDPQMVSRGLDAYTMDESKAFCQRARLELNMPLAAGVSGSTAELIQVATSFGLAGGDLDKYALAVLAYVGGGGNHSYHEIAVVLRVAGVTIDPDTYKGLETLIDPGVLQSLKDKYPDAFVAPPSPPPGP